VANPHRYVVSPHSAPLPVPPLHVKKVGRINLAVIEKFAAANSQLLDRWNRSARWLSDDTVYAAVPESGAQDCPRAHLSKADVEKLVEFGVAVPIAPDSVRGHVRMFAVPEPAKGRRRPIKHTLAVNDILGKETLQKVRFPSKKEICDAVHHGEWSIAFDFAAYFDQFEYAATVGARFCFRSGGGFFRLNTLAMGQRQAVEVAQSCTDALILFPDRRSRTMSVIDNVIFIGSREDVCADATAFVRRVAAAGGSLNELDVATATDEQIAAMATQAQDWCGVHIDLARKQVCLPGKTVDKTARSWDALHTWSWRDLAGHLGLLFWSWGISRAHPSDYFSVLRMVVGIGRKLQERPDLWDAPAKIWCSAKHDLERWTHAVIENVPRDVLPTTPPQLLVVTDASRWGWGYVALDTTTGALHTHGDRWPPGIEARFGALLRRSVVSEPQAIVLAMYRLLSKDGPKRVRIACDNVAAVASGRRGFNPRSFPLNWCQQRLRRIFGDSWTFEFLHVAGKTNVADALSRGQKVEVFRRENDEQSLAEWLRLQVGNGHDLTRDQPILPSTR